MILSERNKKAILSQIEWVEKDISRIREVISRTSFDLEMLENWSDRIKIILESNQDPHENCARCSDPYFCHSENECDGEPHSSFVCDCNLAKFQSTEE